VRADLEAAAQSLSWYPGGPGGRSVREPAWRNDMQSDEPGPAAAPNLSGQSLDAKITDLIIRLIVVGFFAYLSLTLLAPFFIVVVWAVILAVALYPAFAWLRKLLGGRGGLAATLITLLGVGLIVVPLGAVTINVADTTLGLVADFENQTVTVPRPPESVREWPVIGEKVHAAWTLASTNLEAAVKRFGPPLLQAAGAVVGRIAGVGFGMLGFAVSVLVAGFLFVPGPRLGDRIKTFARRVAAERGAHFVDLAAATIRNIARGVIGVALLQAFLTGLILSLFGIPAAGFIAFFVLLFCIVQVGPVPVVLPVIIWAWTAMDTGPALLLTLLLIVIPVIDNVLKPILMARGLSTPMLVILLGVIGGTVTYGLIGLFLGPILLGIFYELLMAWLGEQEPAVDVSQRAEPV
jgi:predicted PurR-regulated permease PerM